MLKVNCPQLKRVIEINSQDSLMKNLIDHKVPVASSCGGDGICGKCKIDITSIEPLSPPSDLERKTLEKNNATASERLSCQLHLTNSATVQTTYW